MFVCVFSLAKLVSPPSVVKKIDWINNHWPEVLPEDWYVCNALYREHIYKGEGVSCY